MYLIVDDRPEVTDAYIASFKREGIAALGMQPQEFASWLGSVPREELEAVETFLLGEMENRVERAGFVRGRTRAPILALCESRDLDDTLDLFSAGLDDVVRKPVHVREIIARANAIWRRVNRMSDAVTCDRLKVFFDGRDIEIDGEPMVLPRRERRILEFLVRNAHRRVTKAQVFNAVYGLFEDSVDEVVVEGHISKLRKKLRMRLGQDVIDAKRYLGYQFCGVREQDKSASESQPKIDAVPAAIEAAAARMEGASLAAA